jgi:hypothetical protein
MMNNDITTMIKALVSGKASEANENFSRVMTSKINSVLDKRKIALASELYNTVKEDAASAASSAASALNLAARDSKSHNAAAEAHKKAAAALHKKREDSAEDRTMSKDQHATLKHKIDRHLKQAEFHSQRATS